jgi:hypothetical protein
MVGYGIVTPQNVARTRPMKGLNSTATYMALVSQQLRPIQVGLTWTLGERAATSCPSVTPNSSMKMMIRSWNPVPLMPALPWP